ncbi:unnamed protein product [Trifolium pratense]|uniref:Uncharacterized protein n=1 Tax=Trifolium pratense TaxID=57577 RepID=A0ACB0M8Z8_TRIPR|nr:unnamed protein product [Trifolium pratense]
MKTIASRGSNANAHNETIVMTFSPFEIQKGVTNFLKICVYFILSSGMTCVGTELVKDAAKIPKGNTVNHQTVCEIKVFFSFICHLISFISLLLAIGRNCFFAYVLSY